MKTKIQFFLVAILFNFSSYGQFAQISLIGSGLSGWGIDIDLTTIDGVVYTASNLKIGAGEIKFRLAHDWATSWGYDKWSSVLGGWPTDTGVTTGDNIPSESGTFDISFNRNTLEYNFFEHKANDDKISVLEGGTATSLFSNAISVLNNDTFALNSTAVLVSNVTSGTLIFNSDGTFFYTHNGSKMLSDSFTYKQYNGISYSKIATVTINVTEVNINPTTDISLSNATINENLNNTIISDLSATDIDTNNVFIYSLVPGVGDTGNLNFAIVNGNQLQNVVPFDFETQSSYSIRVHVNDGGAHSFEKVFTISIGNVNDIAISATPVNSYCSGSISINSVTNTTGIVNYLWTASNGGIVSTTEQNTASITNLPKGTYTIPLRMIIIRISKALT